MIGGPSIATGDSFAAVRALLLLLADPAAAGERLKALEAATLEAKAASDQAHADTVALEAKRTETEAALKTARDQHDAALTDDRVRFNAECAERERIVRAREHEAMELLDRRRVEFEEVVGLKAVLQQKLANIQAAVAA